MSLVGKTGDGTVTTPAAYLAAVVRWLRAHRKLLPAITASLTALGAAVDTGSSAGWVAFAVSALGALGVHVLPNTDPGGPA